MNDLELTHAANELVEAVETRYPRFRFTHDNARDLLAGMLRGDGSTRVADVVAALAWYVGQAPDEPRPSWERIAGRMRMLGTLVSDGVATLRKSQRDANEAREKLDRARAELAAIPPEQWAEVCERARRSALSPVDALPPDWTKKPSWIWLLLRAWREIEGSRGVEARAEQFDASR